MKASILTLVATAALTFGPQLAQAHLLVNDGAIVSTKSVSSKSTLAVMTAAGIRYHGAATYRLSSKNSLAVMTAAGTRYHASGTSSSTRATNSFQVARNSF
jgi:hypothetical protein